MSSVDYREFIASVVKRLGYGGHYFAETVLDRNGGTIRKALKERENDIFIDHSKSGQ